MSHLPPLPTLRICSTASLPESFGGIALPVPRSASLHCTTTASVAARALADSGHGPATRGAATAPERFASHGSPLDSVAMLPDPALPPPAGSHSELPPAAVRIFPT